MSKAKEPPAGEGEERTTVRGIGNGFLMLGRSFFENPLWWEDRFFSRAEAWLDLLQSAAFVPTKRWIAGSVVDIPRGALAAAVRHLSHRWGWSNTKVCHFLDVLERERMITREIRHGLTIVRLCNFDKYNPPVVKKPKTAKTVDLGNDDDHRDGTADKRRPRAREECVEFGRSEGIRPEDAEWFWHKGEGNGWTNGGKPIKNWQEVFRSWKRAGYLPTQKEGLAQPKTGSRGGGRMTVLRRAVAKYGADFGEWVRSHDAFPVGEDDAGCARESMLVAFLHSKGEKA